jgi:hypothetical protein
MKVFISWSGRQSRMVAEGLYNWLPSVIQAIEPFLSADIEKGAQWSRELDEALEGTSFGIVVLTPQNLESTWIHFEAGALSKLSISRVWTLLIALRPTDVKQPLNRFQATLPDEDDIWRLLQAINRHLEKPLTIPRLEEAFHLRWSALKAAIEMALALPSETATPTGRPGELASRVAEVLTLLRETDHSRAISEPREVCLADSQVMGSDAARVPSAFSIVLRVVGRHEAVAQFVQHAVEVEWVASARILRTPLPGAPRDTSRIRVSMSDPQDLEQLARFFRARLPSELKLVSVTLCWGDGGNTH